MRMSIGLKLGIGFALSLLVMVVLVGYSLRVSETALKETVGRQSIFLADNMLLEVNNKLFSILDQLRLEARRPYIREALSRSDQQDRPSGSASGTFQSVLPDDSIIRSRLKYRFVDYYERNEGYTVFEQLYLVDRQRQLITKVGESDHRFHIEDDLWNDVRKNGFHIGQVVFQKDTGLWVIPVAVRINDAHGRLIGVIKATLKASTFFRSLSIGAKKYRTTQIHILTRDGQRLYSTQTFKLLEDLSGQPYFKAIRQKSGFFIAEKGGKEKLFAYTRPQLHQSFEGFQWILLVETDRAEILQPITHLRNQLLLAFGILVVLILIIAVSISRSITRSVLSLQQGAEVIGRGDLDHVIEPSSRDEIGDLCIAFNRMAQRLGESNRQLQAKQQEIELENWLSSGHSNLSEQLQGNLEPEILAEKAIGFLADFLDAETGAFYFSNEEQALQLAAGHAFDLSSDDHRHLKPGEGFIGQAAREGKRRMLTDLPDAFFAIDVGAVQIVPRNFVACPFHFAGEQAGVVFLGRLQPFSENQLLYLDRVMPSIAVAVHSALARQRRAELLLETQRQSEELQTQQEELRQTNEELEEQTRALKASEKRLKEQQEELQQINEELETQQEELRQSNEELEEKTEALERKQLEVEKRNRDLKETRQQLVEKARDLELSNKYKSEFLANMSHELRTPLNSLLIFAQLLYENKQGNLDEKQVEFAQSIHSSGTELLSLINDILDLTKIESGKTEVNVEAIDIDDIRGYLQTYFQPVADDKGIELRLQKEEGLPESIRTDRQKLFQILKNLMANAFKFTEKGSVSVRLFKPSGHLDVPAGSYPEERLGISVSDTGIGIPANKQKLIFEAFQQVNGATNRRFGGTGLGLSICRELTGLLKGDIRVDSAEGKGSTFTVVIPLNIETSADFDPSDIPTALLETGAPEDRIEATSEQLIETVADPPSPVSEEPPEFQSDNPVRDDRDSLKPEKKVILIVDDDRKFAGILADLAHEKGFQCLVAHDGTSGLELANQYRPSAIILDINLPGMDGWTVMEKLKTNPETRPIPVHFISVLDKKMVGLKMGAIGFLTKPVEVDRIRQAFDHIENRINKTIRSLLIVEDDENARKSLSALLAGKDNLEVHFAEDAHTAEKILNTTAIDVMTLDLNLPDMNGFELLSRLEKEYAGAVPPVIVYTGREISEEEEAQLRRHAESIILKGVNSAERLLDEVTLFLHRVDSDLPAEMRDSFRMIHDKESVFKDRQILLVDDDMRNVYAILALLEEKGMTVHVATDGKQGLEVLDANPAIDLVLMDIMMPVMDGYEATRKIREREEWRKLPIIALTAKAMKGDREKCIEAGANDYLAKPIDIEKLYSLLRVWLYQ